MSIFDSSIFDSSIFDAYTFASTATIVWPSTLPQTFKRDSYQEEMVKNVIVSEFEVGPSGLRRRATANVFTVVGSMFMTTDEWEEMQLFLTEETLDRSLCFGFPEQGTTNPVEWLVFMDKPPSRSWLAEDFWQVEISFMVLPQGLEMGTLQLSLYTDIETFYAPAVSITGQLLASQYTDADTFYSPSAGVYVPPVITQVATVQDLTNQTTYTFTGANIGTAAADRLVVVACHIGSVGATGLSSITIGGNAASIDAQIGTGEVVAIASLVVTTGTTADIVVTWAAAAVRCEIAVYTITGLNSTTVSDSFTNSVDGPTSRTGTLTVPLNGCIIAAVSNDGAGPHTWTAGVTEWYDDFVESGDRYSGGSAGPVAATDPYTVTVTHPQTNNVSLAACVWA